MKSIVRKIGASIILQKTAWGRLEGSSYARIGGLLSKEPEALREVTMTGTTKAQATLGFK